jgi:hypothetical protein
MQPVEFPRIPKNPRSLALLQSLDVLSQPLIRPESSRRQKDLGAILHLLAHAPHEFDYLYFCVHNGIQDLNNEYREWYNKSIHSKGQNHMLKVINKEIGELEPHFNSFQLAFFNINEESKRNEDWIPLNNILWAVFCAMFDSQKYDRLMDRIRGIISDIKDQSVASMN